MNALSIHGDKRAWDTPHGQSLQTSVSHVREKTRLALALSAALLSPLAFDAQAAPTAAATPHGAVVNANPNGPQGDPLTVLNCNDSGPGSLRDIITNVAQSGDTVVFTGLQCGTITLTTGEIVVAQNDLTLEGPDSDAGSVTISRQGAGGSRVLHHTGSGTLAIQSLKVRDGYYIAAGNAYGGCIASDSGNIHLNRATVTRCTVYSYTGFANGGGVATLSGNVTLEQSTVSGNTAFSLAKAAFGGGIYARGTLTAKYSSIGNNVEYDGPGHFGAGGGAVASAGATIGGSTIYDNVAADGGGLQVWGNSTILNSTISGNTASNGKGGSALYSAFAESLNIINSTISFNHQDVPSTFGVVFYGSQANSVLTLQSSIIANNTAGAANTPADLSIRVGHGIPSGFDNLVVASNIAMPPAGFITVSTDPQLGPLRLNGGWTPTHALLPGSPALQKGNNNAMLPTDQRGDGYPRTTGPNASVDIGAVQFETVFADDFDFD